MANPVFYCSNFDKHYTPETKGWYIQYSTESGDKGAILVDREPTSKTDALEMLQAIDDEFLEWFIKNPNCEYVEIDKYLGFGGGYQILIPNEEPKLITDWLEAYGNPEIEKQVEREVEELMKIHSLEEIAKNKHRELSTAPIGIIPNFTDGFIEGYKLAEQRIETLRNELYNQLPTGDVNAFDLIKIINNHIKKLDELN